MKWGGLYTAVAIREAYEYGQHLVMLKTDADPQPNYTMALFSACSSNIMVFDVISRFCKLALITLNETETSIKMKLQLRGLEKPQEIT